MMAFITINYMYYHCRQLPQSNLALQKVAGPSSMPCLHGSQPAYNETGFQSQPCPYECQELSTLSWLEFLGMLRINQLMTNLLLINHH